MSDEKIHRFIKELPDRESAARFLSRLAEKFPAEEKKLLKNDGLLSDILTLVSFSPLLTTTILQNPIYISWLNRQRISTKVRGKEEILESLARFAMTNSALETNILLARFRRRELLRIYLQDIRNLETIAEITEEISNLADACLEYALRIARQELDNRFGTPLETDEKGRAAQAGFCIVALGKLGSKELNYSSDIDLLFLYSAEGKTSGHGTRGAVTNREYFVKLAEFIIKLVGGQSGEGAAYRVDMRLRPHGRVGALAIPVGEAVSYYRQAAQNWERQVLIRSRASAGDAEIFHLFFEKVRNYVFSKDGSVEKALQNVRQSKEKINLEKISANGFDVKLGRGGIREIEFIAQALQLAYGGGDEWLRVPHTLICLARLADRKLLSETDLTELSDAYAFLRRLEHRLQMENGLQTHLVPDEAEKRFLIAKRMNFANLEEFETVLEFHTRNVNQIFTRIFGKRLEPAAAAAGSIQNNEIHRTNSPEPRATSHEPLTTNKIYQPILSSLEKSDIENVLSENDLKTLEELSRVSPHFAELIAANPGLIKYLPNPDENYKAKDFQKIFLSAIKNETGFARKLAVLRANWQRFLLEIVIFDVFDKFSQRETKHLQTTLAEASLETAILITKVELEKKYAASIDEFPFAVLGLGKLGGKGMDYGSDLDLVLVYDDEKPLPVKDLTHAEFYGRAVEIFVTTLSAMTREGSLYRVDLRLRPDGKNGATSIGKTTFLNYLNTRAAIWEWLAYVKIRGAAGDIGLADFVAREARRIIHQNALQAEENELKEETRRVRKRLEEEKTVRRNSREIDIKFGEGGMLDVYFAMRFLQLRDNIPDDPENRSTDFMLQELYEKDSLSAEDFKNLSEGYRFLSELDHHLRLTVGRSTRLPLANRNALQIIVERMRLNSVSELVQILTFHRLNIRASFENIIKI